MAFYLSGIYSGIISDIYSDILSGILSDILFTWGSGQEEKSREGIASLQLRSGGEHSDPGFAVRVRRGPLRSRACTGGQADNTLILGLLFGSGGDRCDHELAVKVRRGTP